MSLTKGGYMFFEWLIIAKGMTKEKYAVLTEEEFNALVREYFKERCTE